jgi:hypothetical protein
MSLRPVRFVAPRAARLLSELALALVLLGALPYAVLAHRSGCHRWHSCPSDRGTYTCGDLGYCSACPDNQYCEARQPRAAQAPAQQSPQSEAGRPGVPPQSAWQCPLTHPIKGNFTPSSGERCIYHVPGGEFYSRTKPERCYVTGDEAVRDGCRRSKR